MNREIKPAWVVVLVLVGLIGAMLLLRTSEELQPELLSAFVAIEVAGDDVARVGSVRIGPETQFRLHAVVEALDWRGRTVYFTDARALELEGERVASEQLSPWSQPGKVRVLWFTVEGAPPFMRAETVADLERLNYFEVFQPDWPQSWSTPGRIDPAVPNFLPDSEDGRVPARFGTQRFHVRVELFTSASDILPATRLRSPGATELEQSSARVATVVVELDWPLEAVSRVFGLPQVEVLGESSRGVLEALAPHFERGLAFSRAYVLRKYLGDAGERWEELDWQAVELNGEGDWLWAVPVRAGSKVAFTYEDRGVAGKLDSGDLCLDFDKGATVRTLAEIFVGEGLVEIAAAPTARESDI